MNWCILIPLLVGALCALLGYFLGKYLGANHDEYDIKIARLEAELDECKSSKATALSSLENELKTTKSSLTSKISDFSNLENQLSTAKLSLDSSNASKVSLEDELKAAKTALEASKASKTGLESQLNTTKLSLDSSNASKVSLEDELKAAKSALEASKTSKINLENELKDAKSSLESANSSKASLETQLNTTKVSLDACLKSKSDMSASIAAAAAAPVLIPFNGDAAKAVFGKKIKQDDLTVVEGIGPKIQQLFHNHDVKTWKALSECSIEKCQTVLDSGGERYKIHKPNTWPKQAELAYQGKWAELLKWQDELDGGK